MLEFAKSSCRKELYDGKLFCGMNCGAELHTLGKQVDKCGLAWERIGGSDFLFLPSQMCFRELNLNVKHSKK